jgi:hypothetical protein
MTKTTTPSGKSWMEEIDERIRLKASNVTTFQPSPVSVQRAVHVESPKGDGSKQPAVGTSRDQQEKSQKTEIVQQPEQKKETTEKKSEFGTGISADQIDRIVRDFQK